MNDLLAVLTQNILPIFIVASLGFLAQRYLELDKGTLNKVVFNILSPCLVFASLVNSPLPGGELAELAFFAIISITLMGMIAYGLSRIMRLSRTETAAMLVVVMFVNGGNYGLTLNELRYGEEGLARAVVYFITSTIIIFSAGIFISSLGKLTWRESLTRMAKLPAVYAAILAIVVYSLKIPVPTPIMSAVELTGRAAIPVMILVLGMQIADLDRTQRSRIVWPSVGLRLLIGPLVGILVALFLGLKGLSRSTAIIEASMPTAVFTMVLAAEFDLPVSAVAYTVVVSTLLSPITVAATIALLNL